MNLPRGRWGGAGRGYSPQPEGAGRAGLPGACEQRIDQLKSDAGGDRGRTHQAATAVRIRELRRELIAVERSPCVNFAGEARSHRCRVGGSSTTSTSRNPAYRREPELMIVRYRKKVVGALTPGAVTWALLSAGERRCLIEEERRSQNRWRTSERRARAREHRTKRSCGEGADGGCLSWAAGAKA
jgi:hypothetical protein